MDNAECPLMAQRMDRAERCMAGHPPLATKYDAVTRASRPRSLEDEGGPCTDNSNDMGPLVTKPHFEKVKAYVDSGVAEGATLVVDGRGVKVAGHEEGYFLAPACSTTSSPA